MGTTTGTVGGRPVLAKVIGMALVVCRAPVVFRTLGGALLRRTSLSSTRLAVDPTLRT